MNFDYQGIEGYDVSTYQDSPQIPGHIDFHKMKDAGASFVILKAGQGDWIDPDFNVGWTNAKNVLPRASYWYYDNLYPPKEQAQRYWNIIKHDLEGICWLDLEDRLLGQYQGWKKWYDWLKEFQVQSQLPDDRIGIYTNFYYWTENLRSATTAEKFYFLRHPLWLASYPPDPYLPDYKNILVPLPWTSPIILQTGTPAVGIDVGVESREVDYNQFNGDLEEFQKYFKLVDEGEPEPMNDYMELTPNVSGEYRSIRQQVNYPRPPHITGTKIGQINAGSSGKALATDFYTYTEDIIINGTLQAKTGDIWWKTFEANGSEIAGWVAEIHKGVRYLNLRFVPAPAPEPALPTLLVEISDVEGLYIPVTVELKPK